MEEKIDCKIKSSMPVPLTALKDPPEDVNIVSNPSLKPKSIINKSEYCVSQELLSQQVEQSNFPLPDSKRKHDLQSTESSVNPSKLQKSFASQKNFGKGKTSDLCNTGISGEIDLCSILPMDDCEFLAQTLWVFTAKQLKATLDLQKERSNNQYVDIVSEISIWLNYRYPNLEQSNGNDKLPTITSSNVSDIESQAQDKIKMWENILSRPEIQNNSSARIQFSLAGPIKFLLPEWLKTFLFANHITTVNSFLSTKKTEASQIVTALCQHRTKHNMTSLRPTTCARYLLGISLRFQIAVTTIPYTDKVYQAWTGSALVVLTGIPKDFLLSKGYTSPDQLLQAKTKDVANQFINWRDKQGLPCLRGSGPVAFVSGWKTSVKEAIECENSMSFSELSYLDSDELYNIHSSEAHEQYDFSDFNPDDENNSSGIETNSLKSTSPISMVNRIMETSLNGILNRECVSFLLSVGIRTISDLRNMNKSEGSYVVKTMIEWRKKAGLATITPSQCVQVLYGWERRAAQKNDNRVARYSDPRKINVNSHPLRHVLKASILRFLSSVGIYTAKDLYKSDKRECSKIVKAMIKWRTDNGLTKIRPSSCVRLLYDWAHLANTYKTRKEKIQPTGKPHHEKINLLEMDPLKVLSKVSRDFLHSQGITNAAQFLSVKSSSLTAPYVSWRADKAMTTLKGSGAIATISGWKSSVKEACKKQGFKDIDLTRLAEVYVLPNEESMINPLNVRYENRHITNGSNLPENDGASTSFLLGLPYVKMTVVNQVKDIFYDFKMVAHPIRKYANGSEIYLTYLGARVLRSKEFSYNGKNDRFNRNRLLSTSCAILPDVTASNFKNDKKFEAVNHELFCTLNEGCGLINIGVYNPFPLLVSIDKKKSDLFDALKTFILSASSDISLSFNTSISTTHLSSSSVDKKIFENDSNVLVFHEQGYCKFLFHVSQQLEKGQTIKLNAHLAKGSSVKRSNDYNNIKKNKCKIYLRKVISKLVSTMSWVEVDTAAMFLKENVLNSIISGMKSNKTNPNSDANNVKREPGLMLSTSLISRRRLHWVAELLNLHLKVIQQRSLNDMNGRNNGPLTDALSYVKFNQSTRQYISDIRNNNADFYKAMVDEVINEILFTMSSTTLPPFEDKSSWCKMSSNFLSKILRSVADYFLSDQYDTFEAQMKLSDEITRITKRTIKLLNDYCTETDVNKEHPSIQKAAAALTDLAFYPSSVENVCSETVSTYDVADDIEIMTQSTDSFAKNKSTVSLLVDFQAYKEIAELCDGSFILSVDEFSKVSDELIVVVTDFSDIDKYKTEHAVNEHRFVARGVKSVEKCITKINKSWYLNNQIFCLLDLFEKSFVTKKWVRTNPNTGLSEPIFSLDRLINHAMIATTDASFEMTKMALPQQLRDDIWFNNEWKDTNQTITPQLNSIFSSLKRKKVIIESSKGIFPCTQPIFLSSVWPVLCKRGWILRKASNSLFYVPPSLHKKKYSSNRLSTNSLAEASNIDSKDQDLLPYTLKRVLTADFEKIMNSAENMNINSSMDDTSYISVKKLLNLYVEFRTSSSPEVNSSVIKESDVESSKFKSVANCFILLFEETSMSLLYKKEKCYIECNYKDLVNSRDSHADIFGPEYFLRLLSILPVILDSSNSELPDSEVKQTLLYAQDIMVFICQQYETILDKKYTSLFELYTGPTPLHECDEDSLSLTSNSINNVTDQNSQDEEEQSIPITESDRSLITDHFYFLFCQTRPYHVSNFDSFRGKRRGLKPGTAGIACRHCYEMDIDGNKFFFSNATSLGAVPAVLHSHLLKCPKVSSSIKIKLEALKAIHPEQRKTLRHGSLTVFYNQLWGRLCGSKRLEDEESTTFSENSGSVSKVKKNKIYMANHKFPIQCHVDVMKYIGRTIMTENDGVIASSYHRYYSCIAHGSKIKTNEDIPINRGAEWVLKDFQELKSMLPYNSGS